MFTTHSRLVINYDTYRMKQLCAWTPGALRTVSGCSYEFVQSFHIEILIEGLLFLRRLQHLTDELIY